MLKDINLLKERRILFKKKTRKLFLIRFWSLLTLIIYGILVFLSFFSFFLLNKHNEDLKTAIDKEKKTIIQLQPIETKLFYLHIKTKSLKQIMAERKKNQEIVEGLFKLLVNGVSVSDFEIISEGRVNFNATCSSFGQLVAFLRSLEKSEDFSVLQVNQATISDLSYGFSQEYKFNISLKLKENQEK